MPAVKKNDSQSVAERFAQHLDDHLSVYYPDVSLQGAKVQLVRKSERLNSQLYEYSIAGGTDIPNIFVKVPFAQKHLISSKCQASEIRRDRPRLFPKANPQDKGLHEFNTLQVIHEYFDKLGDERFGAVRVLDLLSDPYTLIVEKGQDPGLGCRLRNANRFLSLLQSQDLDKGFHNSGAWLRKFHEFQPPAHSQTRHARRDDFLAAVDKFVGFLLDTESDQRFLNNLRDDLLKAAELILPNAFSLGVSHSDYAPRNILLSPGGRVTVFDTQARWQAPIYEDLAHFLIALKASGPQSSSQGLLYSSALLARYEKKFLEGYFERRDVPVDAIRLFECLLLIERWTSISFRYFESFGLRRLVKGCRLALWRRFISRYLSQSLHQVLRR